MLHLGLASDVKRKAAATIRSTSRICSATIGATDWPRSATVRTLSRKSTHAVTTTEVVVTSVVAGIASIVARISTSIIAVTVVGLDDDGSVSIVVRLSMWGTAVAMVIVAICSRCAGGT